MTESFPSLAIVEAEVERERDRQDRRSDALDSKAGILLGFAGAVTALAAAQPGAWADVAVTLSALAAVLAVLAFLPRSFAKIEVVALRRRYLASDERFTRHHLLDTKISAGAQVNTLLDQKATLVTLSAFALLAAAVVTALARTLAG